MKCNKCNAEIPENYGYCTMCEKPISNIETKANIFLAILSVLFPFVGIILYFTQKKKEPRVAKTYGKCALFSVIFSIILSIICLAVLLSTKASFKDETPSSTIINGENLPEKEYLESPDGNQYIAGRITILANHDASEDEIRQLVSTLGGEILYKKEPASFYLLQFEIDDYDGTVICATQFRWRTIKDYMGNKDFYIEKV